MPETERNFYPAFYERGVRTNDADENDTMPRIGNDAYYAYIEEVVGAATARKIDWTQVELAIVLDRLIRADEQNTADV